MTLGIKDIARLSGVSTATVSRTLSRPDLVSEETRKAVMAVIDSHGYRVNQVARSLRMQRAHAVLALLPDLGNPFFSLIISGIQEVLTGHGIDLLVTDRRSSRASAQKAAAHLRAARADGLICLDGGLDAAGVAELCRPDIRRRVVQACEWLEGTDFPSVRSDNRTGMRLAVDHLVELGHRRIGFLAGPPGNVLTHERRAGAVAALTAHGQHLPENLIAGHDFTLEAGFAAARLIAAERPSAVLCSSDQLAIGLISGLAAQGLSVPGDISVVGFDDIAYAPFAAPPLTTIRQDRLALGRAAAQLMLDSLSRLGIEGPEAARSELIPVELILRASTRQVDTAGRQPRQPYQRSGA